MATRKIVIFNVKQNIGKVFDININKLEEILDYINYNHGVFTKDLYFFSNPVNFQLVDLYLSTFATPQPILRSIA